MKLKIITNLFISICIYAFFWILGLFIAFLIIGKIEIECPYSPPAQYSSFTIEKPNYCNCLIKE